MVSMGSPSGHTMSPIGYLLTLYLMFFHDGCQDRQITLYERIVHRLKSSLLLNIACLLFIGTITLMMAVSRFAIAVHAINHLLFGFMIGLWYALFMFYVIKPFLYEHISKVLHKDS